jgi:hypothetical protein
MENHFQSSVYYYKNRVLNFISLAFTRTDTIYDPSPGSSDNNVFGSDTVPLEMSVGTQKGLAVLQCQYIILI